MDRIESKSLIAASLPAKEPEKKQRDQKDLVKTELLSEELQQINLKDSIIPADLEKDLPIGADISAEESGPNHRTQDDSVKDERPSEDSMKILRQERREPVYFKEESAATDIPVEEQNTTNSEISTGKRDWGSLSSINIEKVEFPDLREDYGQPFKAEMYDEYDYDYPNYSPPEFDPMCRKVPLEYCSKMALREKINNETTGTTGFLGGYTESKIELEPDFSHLQTPENKFISTSKDEYFSRFQNFLTRELSEPSSSSSQSEDEDNLVNYDSKEDRIRRSIKRMISRKFEAKFFIDIPGDLTKDQTVAADISSKESGPQSGHHAQDDSMIPLDDDLEIIWENIITTPRLETAPDIPGLDSTCSSAKKDINTNSLAFVTPVESNDNPVPKPCNQPGITEDHIKSINASLEGEDKAVNSAQKDNEEFNIGKNSLVTKDLTTAADISGEESGPKHHKQKDSGKGEFSI